MSGIKLPENWQSFVANGADALRALALNERAKKHISDDPVLLPIARRIAHRFIAGETINEALVTLQLCAANGHYVTVDYMGESCRDEAFASAETAQFIELIDRLNANNIESSISLDLSHIGSMLSYEIGLANAQAIASACKQSGREMIISAEGSDRTELTHRIYEALCVNFDNVGITVQARLHRTAQDLKKLLQLPGKIRLVKGAYFEPETTAHARTSPALLIAYNDYARQLIESGHRCSIATHDRSILDGLHQFIQTNNLQPQPFEFEMLLGLWDDQLETAKSRGYATREYAVYGKEWFLYVCNRIAEEPIRLYQALVDAVDATTN
jgi:proline dehydrogenase